MITDYSLIYVLPDIFSYAWIWCIYVPRLLYACVTGLQDHLQFQWFVRTHGTQQLCSWLWFITSKGYNATVSKGKRHIAWGPEQTKNNLPFPIKSQRTHLILPAMNCDNMCDWLAVCLGSSLEVLCLGFIGLVTETCSA